ncbi:hypothetical protein [Leifsonia poae]|uniref:hypothetical protein n=1 Tax=Leifsonia poae TaxID=110933 RepID=UPI003D66B31F
MTTLRVGGVQFLADKKLRVGGVTFTGTGTTPTLRFGDVVFSGNAALTVRPFPDVTVEAFDAVTVTATVGATSPPATGYLWRQVSGPTTLFQDNGSSITFTAPAAVAGTTVVFGVTALLDTQSSPETVATVNVIPHLYWIAGSSGWIPLTRTATA